MTEIVAHLKLDDAQIVPLQPVVLPPGKQNRNEAKSQTVATSQVDQKRGVFSKISAFFASIFH
jgi:hypothetical protein